uniref:IRG-type G domain-containing protein n=1 Tax=Periophthalmus magnuspinnatus TaxID=409849 RepID=A0A3B3ZS00_9GOBI
MAECEDLSPELKEVQEAVEKGGLPLAAARAQKALVEFENTKLAIAITGETGSGKSSLVNAIRGIDHTHDKAAPVGVVETTMEPTKYTYPNNPNIEIWDLPGIGTTKFRAAEYVKKMEFKRYDFFIIVSNNRFKENDTKLAQEIQKMKKHFYFIRSKIDSDLGAAEKSQRNFNKDQTLQTIKDDCIKKLVELEVECPKVFLVSAFELHLYDFPTFYKTLEKELPEKQRDALLLVLPNVSPDIINKKKKKLHQIIVLKALISGAGGAIPIPGLSGLIDVGLIVSFAILCQKSVFLTSEGLQNLSRLSAVPLEELKRGLKSPLAGIKITHDVIMKVLTTSAVYIGLVAIEELFKWVPILLGSVVGVTLSLATTYKALKYILDSLIDDAQTVFTRAKKTDFGLECLIMFELFHIS